MAGSSEGKAIPTRTCLWQEPLAGRPHRLFGAIDAFLILRYPYALSPTVLSHPPRQEVFLAPLAEGPEGLRGLSKPRCVFGDFILFRDLKEVLPFQKTI
jgi:hypothetical protein